MAIGQPRPNASNINVEGAGATISTLVTVPMGADGKVNIFTQSGGHLVADVAVAAHRYVRRQRSTRVLDTRSGPEQTPILGDRPGVVPSSTYKLRRGPVPAPRSAVVLSLTVPSRSAGFVTIWPAGTTRARVGSQPGERGRH